MNLDAVLFVLGWSAPRLPIYLDGQRRTSIRWHQYRLLERHAGEWWDRQVELGAPDDRNTALWCWIDSPAAQERVRRFTPRPSLALQIGRGARKLALWALQEPSDVFSVEAANRRLAYGFGAAQKLSDPSLLRVPLPGTCVRLGRKRPLPVTLTRAEADFYDLDAVVGELRDPPPSWAQRQRESGAWS